MLLFMIMHVIVSTVLVGIAFTVVMVTGNESLTFLLYSMAGAAMLALPITYAITKALASTTNAAK